jgi:putative addiction module killer protein
VPEQDWELEYYILENGHIPFRDWLESLRDLKTRVIIKSRISRLTVGHFGNCESVGSGVFEQKIDYGPGYRVYFGKAAGKVILLLCGGDKSTQRQDILRAHYFWHQFKAANL